MENARVLFWSILSIRVLTVSLYLAPMSIFAQNKLNENVSVTKVDFRYIDTKYIEEYS